MRFQPADIFAKIGSSCARLSGLGGRSGPAILGLVIEPAMPVVFDEFLVALPRRRSGAHETT
jgi:hypothetical protein